MRILELLCKKDNKNKNKDNNNLEFIQIGKKFSDKQMSYISEYLEKLHNLKVDIINSSNPNEFLSFYNNNSCEECKKEKVCCKSDQFFVSPTKAYHRLHTFQNGIFGDIIKYLEKLNIDILIGGSSGLAAILKKSEWFKSFEPTDMDIYIKYITDNKIKLVDDALRQAFPNDKMIIVRRPLTLTWWIYDDDNNYKAEIQLNILYIRSWSEIFVVYHSDMVSIGYEIKTKNFVILTRRWHNFVQGFPFVWITNLNSNERIDILESSAKKYLERGFIPFLIKINNDNNNKNINKTNKMDNGEPILSGHHESNEKLILDKLIKIYHQCQDIAISDTVDYLYTDKFPRYINIDALNENSEFVKYVLNYEYPNGPICPVTLESYNIAVANKNCKHEVSLKAYILTNTFTECPICRAIFNPYICNTFLPNKLVTKNKKVIKHHKLNFQSVVPISSYKDNYMCELFPFDITKIKNSLVSCKCEICVERKNKKLYKQKLDKKLNKNDKEINLKKIKYDSERKDDDIDIEIENEEDFDTDEEIIKYSTEVREEKILNKNKKGHKDIKSDYGSKYENMTIGICKTLSSEVPRRKLYINLGNAVFHDQKSLSRESYSDRIENLSNTIFHDDEQAVICEDSDVEEDRAVEEDRNEISSSDEDNNMKLMSMVD